ncbi:MAG: succinate dehydrogenase, cytochrome b556 subunit [Gammaproteobacteria bacterium]|nr:succinate dehydrogenase, cytochrome b556 subunit [Gammaproteobacteria bacterium]
MNAAPQKRPVYLNLFQIRLPIGGMVSILHRVTGVLLVLALPLAVFLLQRSLESAAGFAQVSAWLSPWPVRVLLLLLALTFLQHLYSGIRHLLLDLDIGVDRSSSRNSAWLTLVATALSAVALGWLILA